MCFMISNNVGPVDHHFDFPFPKDTCQILLISSIEARLEGCMNQGKDMVLLIFPMFPNSTSLSLTSLNDIRTNCIEFQTSRSKFCQNFWNLLNSPNCNPFSYSFQPGVVASYRYPLILMLFLNFLVFPYPTSNVEVFLQIQNTCSWKQVL